MKKLLLLSVMITLSALATFGQQANFPPASGSSTSLTFGSTTIPLSSTAPTINQVLSFNGTSIVGSASGSGTPCTTTALSIQYNAAGVFGCEPDFTFTAPHTLTLGASGIFTITAGATVNGLTLAMLPSGVGLTANPLSQFASTTSAQLRSILSDESGTGAALFANGAFGTPTSLVLTNATLLPCGALPALTGQVTTSAGSCSTTVGTLNQNTTGTAATITGSLALANTPLTTSQDILYDNAGALGRLPIVTSGTCLGNTGGVWASLTCSGGSGGDTITSPNSTLNVGGTSSATTLDLAGSVGEIMAGATPALTFTPTLGISGTAGTLSLFPASGNFTTKLGSAATASNTVNFFATAPVTGDLVDCVTASTTCTLTDSGVLAANVVTTTSNIQFFSAGTISVTPSGTKYLSVYGGNQSLLASFSVAASLIGRSITITGMKANFTGTLTGTDTLAFSLFDCTVTPATSAGCTGAAPTAGAVTCTAAGSTGGSGTTSGTNGCTVTGLSIASNGASDLMAIQIVQSVGAVAGDIAVTITYY
jgi:hypothetical protein